MQILFEEEWSLWLLFLPSEAKLVEESRRRLKSKLK
jgi:hypothetical protein